MPILGRQQGFKDSSGVNEFRGEGMAFDDHADGGGVRVNDANQNSLPSIALHGMRAQQSKRLAMLRARQRGKIQLQLRHRFLRYALTRIFSHFGQVSRSFYM